MNSAALMTEPTKRQTMNTEKIVLEIATAPPEHMSLIAMVANAYLDGLVAGMAQAGQMPTKAVGA